MQKDWKDRLQKLREKSVVIDYGEFPTLSDDDDSAKTDEENREWYRQRASEFEFHPMLTTCTYCGEREASYNGITSGLYDVITEKVDNGVIFQFCKICRDELQMIKLQTKASRS